MKTNLFRVLGNTVLLFVMLLFDSCKKEDATKLQEMRVMNIFTMQLNGQNWKPSLYDDDTCRPRYVGAWSSVTKSGYENQLFTITAFSNLSNSTSGQSDHLEIQITDVTRKGRYDLTGHWHYHDNAYAVFRRTTAGNTTVVYMSKEKTSSFTVQVDDIIPIRGSILKEIKGSFEGTVYRVDNPSDSLVIQRGTFEFKKPNRYDFQQCAM